MVTTRLICAQIIESLSMNPYLLEFLSYLIREIDKLIEVMLRQLVCTVERPEFLYLFTAYFHLIKNLVTFETIIHELISVNILAVLWPVSHWITICSRSEGIITHWVLVLRLLNHVYEVVLWYIFLYTSDVLEGSLRSKIYMSNSC